jgi:hypothetical protein
MNININKNQWEQIGKEAGWLTAQMYSGYETVSLGSTPSGEKCAQVGSEHYYELTPIEITAYKNQCERMFPNIPDGARYVKTRNPHDFGTYHELGIKYREDDEEAMNYAYNVENNTPEYWDEQAHEELKQKGYYQFEKESVERLSDPAPSYGEDGDLIG